ncbi:hypothetical protein ACWEPC_05255 [Nonomuraea sp. NPDC004297]
MAALLASLSLQGALLTPVAEMPGGRRYFWVAMPARSSPHSPTGGRYGMAWPELLDGLGGSVGGIIELGNHRLWDHNDAAI